MNQEQDSVREFPTGAKRDGEAGKLRYTAALSPYALSALVDYMRRHNTQAHRTEENWKSGIPLDSFLASQFRHMMHQWIKHEQKEYDQELIDAVCGAAFNCLGYLHELVKPGERRMATEHFTPSENT